MRLRLPTVVALALAAGLLRNPGVDGLLRGGGPALVAVAVHFLGPLAFASLAVTLWRRASPPRQLAVAGVCLLLAETTRWLHFGLDVGWRPLGRLLLDSKGQFLLALSLAVQIGALLLGFAAARWLVRRRAGRETPPPHRTE